MSTVTTIGSGPRQVGLPSARHQRLGRGADPVLKFFAPLSPCLIGIEACASPRHWSRELQSLGWQERQPRALRCLADATGWLRATGKSAVGSFARSPEDETQPRPDWRE